MRQSGKCSLCNRLAVTRGMCRPHYSSWWRRNLGKAAQTIKKPEPLRVYPIEITFKNCLRCGQLFESKSRFNRCCEICNRANREIGERYEIWVP